MKLPLLLVVLLASSSVHAQIIWHTQNGPELVLSSARAAELRHRSGADQLGGLMRSINAVPGGTGAVAVVDRIKGPGPLGPVIDVNIRRTLPWASISRAVAKSLPLISTAVAIAEIAEAIRCRESSGGSSECDPGTDEATQAVQRWRFTDQASGYTSGYVYTSAELACNVGAHGDSTGRLGYGSATRVMPDCRFNVYFTNGVLAGQRVYSVSSSTVNVTACPEVVVNGVTLVPVKGPDGKCATNVYEPASEDVVATKAETWGDKARAPQLVGELDAASKPIEHPWPQSDPVPDSVQGPRETTTHPDGSVTVKDTKWEFAPTPKGYEWAPSVTVKDFGPGEPIPAPGGLEGGTTTSGGNAPERDVITCGLPDTPACKIDETGTPAAGAWSAARSDLEGAAQGLRDLLPGADAPGLPWLWGGINMPAGACSNIEVAGPWTGIEARQLDICGQPWVEWWRVAWAWLLGLYAALHCYRLWEQTIGRS